MEDHSEFSRVVAVPRRGPRPSGPHPTQGPPSRTKAGRNRALSSQPTSSCSSASTNATINSWSQWRRPSSRPQAHPSESATTSSSSLAPVQQQSVTLAESDRSGPRPNSGQSLPSASLDDNLSSSPPPRPTGGLPWPSPSSSSVGILSELLQEYGEQDKDWKNKIYPADHQPEAGPTEIDPTPQDAGPTDEEGDGMDHLPLDQHHQHDTTTTIPTITAITTTTTTPPISRLGGHGQAPAHVTVASFGYQRGGVSRAPGWSYADPLPPWDCRSWPTVPGHLAWAHGLSGHVKRAMLAQASAPAATSSSSASNSPAPPASRGLHPSHRDHDSHRDSTPNPLRLWADQVAQQVAGVLVEALSPEPQGGGGFGYDQPLAMTIWLGSDYGRHRSVVLAELVATCLRNLLRRNEHGQFPCPCSVSTFHRDIDKPLPPGASNNNKKKSAQGHSANNHARLARKGRGFESDDEDD